MSYTAVGVPESSPLERFARWFHQDWRLMYADFDEGARMYVARLEDAERTVLREQLAEFLLGHQGKKEKGLRNAWNGLGAEALPPQEKLSVFLRRALESI